MSIAPGLPACPDGGAHHSGKPAPCRVAWRVTSCILAAGVWAAAMAPGAAAQGSKRLAAPTPGLPWSGCEDVEGFVADQAGQYSVQSARCGDASQVWLLQRGAADAGGSPDSQVLDHLTLRALRTGEMLSAGPYCRSHGRELRWVAIYEWKGRKRINGRSGGVVEAWMPNLQTGRIEPASRSLIRAASCAANPDE